jgi:putative long chain acyl-CoA synthase
VSRIGACAVLLRPEGDFERELRLGEIDHLVVDREHLREGRERFAERVLLHAPDADARPEPGVRDLASLAAQDAALPGWYAPDLGRAEEVAFVLFTGHGEATRATRITNRRWALAALGAASATALTPKDTVYCWTPIHHPTGLLVSMSAALVSGARFAASQGFAAASFWEEVRRYGASVVFYAGTMCRELLEAPPDPRERHHPVRVFAGSGMPRPLWQRLVGRFRSIGVVELYASSEGTAILANVSGVKLGSVGRPIPGSAEVALASFDLRGGTLLRDAQGFALPAKTGAPGLLLARAEPEQETLGTRPLRSVFERGDAWTATGDLFRCDADGDYWLVDHVADLISTPSGRVPSLAIEEAIWELDAVSAAAVYGLPLPDSAFERPAAAVMLRPGERLSAEALGAAVVGLPLEGRPTLVSIVEQIPLTAGYRFDKRALRSGELSADGSATRVLAYQSEIGTYREVDPGDGD